MSLIETYQHKEEGYHPFLIREGWQVAQLNYTAEQDLMNIGKLEKHSLTDEVFILLQGIAVLIAANKADNVFVFECVRMQPGITYNIPVNQWHNIAMSKDTELIIVERNHTHMGDCDYKQLNHTQKDELENRILALI